MYYLTKNLIQLRNKLANDQILMAFQKFLKYIFKKIKWK